MTTTSALLAGLPAPAVIETVSFDTIVQEMRDDLVARFPAIANVIDLESEPARKLIEVFAYRETLLRARINDAARAVLLATATGSDLDNLGALFDVWRLTVTPADPTATPPVAAVMETDDAFRARIQLSPEGYTTAGSAGAYKFFAFSADARVIDVSVGTPTAGTVDVTILSSEADGTPSAGLLSIVTAALSGDTVRPMNDTVAVQAPTITTYAVTAKLWFDTGANTAAVTAAAQAALETYCASVHKLGATAALSGMYAALQQPGVTRARILTPYADVTTTASEVPTLTSATLTAG